MCITSPPCPDCSTVTERIEVEGEEVWRCTAADCVRRTYGTGDPDDDDALPPYTETDESGAVFVHHGTGEVDIEATAELAAQDGPDEDDDPLDLDQPAPAAPTLGHRAVDDRGTAPGDGNAPPVPRSAEMLTDRDGGAGHEQPVPHRASGHSRTAPCPDPSPVGHE